MIQNDYIMRMVEMFITAILRITRLKKEDHEEALLAIDELSRKILGLSSKSIDTVTGKDILNLFTRNGELEAEKVIIAANILIEEADIFAGILKTEESCRKYVKALNLMLEVLLGGRKVSLPKQYIQPDETVGKLKEYDIPAETQYLLMQYYEKAGRYSKAEDMLFELLEKTNSDYQTVQNGLAFYRRLLEKTPDELESGNLPEEEVQEGLERLLGMNGQ